MNKEEILHSEKIAALTEYDIQDMRVTLLELQAKLHKSNRNLIILIEGFDRPGANNLLNKIRNWLDPRYLTAYAFDRLEDAYRSNILSNFAIRMPNRHTTAFFLNAWNTATLLENAEKKINNKELKEQFSIIESFEKALGDDGSIIVKLWLDISEDEYCERAFLAENISGTVWPAKNQNDKPKEQFQVLNELYKNYVSSPKNLPSIPWYIISETDTTIRHLQAIDLLNKKLKTALSESETTTNDKSSNVFSVSEADKTHEGHPLASIPLDQKMAKEDYKERMNEDLKPTLNRLSHKAAKKKKPIVALFEGWDAAGKGGVIKRMISAMDAANYTVHPIGVPTHEELNHHYLWRFWTRIPRPGHMAIFDRSWYGRVLVERVENLASTEEWSRAYEEINAFEHYLNKNNYLLLKFWIHISSDEQLIRFNKRESTSHKRHKITPEDYRNRQRWSEYEDAVFDMVKYTNTPENPWHLIPGNNKYYARVRVMETICNTLEEKI